jgi:hypothetical protein
LQADSEVDDLGGVAHLEIELGHDIGPEPFEVALLYVATIRRRCAVIPLAPARSQRLAATTGSGSAFFESGIVA